MLIADWEEFSSSSKGGAERTLLLLHYSLKRGQKSRAAVYHFSTLRKNPPTYPQGRSIYSSSYLSESVDGEGGGGRWRAQVRVSSMKKEILPFSPLLEKKIYTTIVQEEEAKEEVG
jgi:hypothetical protein